MVESMTIELGLDEHHRLAAAGEHNAARPQPRRTPPWAPRRHLAAALVALAARLDPAARAAIPTQPRPTGA
jgi:hypothetical protein